MTPNRKDKKLKKPKKLKEYKQTQLTLPGLFPGPKENYSSTIELYDAIPKHDYEKPANRIEGRFLDPVEKEFEFRNESFVATIIPARIEEKKGEYKDYFPGLKEELIEDALRKMISDDKSGVYLDDQAGVVFTLYQLQKELEEVGHKYSITQLKQALLVCSGTRIKLESISGTEIFESNIFENIGLQTKEEWKGKGKKTTCFVRFNYLVDKSIKECTFRPLNYTVSMKFKSTIARWLYKRMNQVYIQASSRNPYNINLLYILRNSARKKKTELRKNVAQVRKALNEMVDVGVLIGFDEKRILEGRKLVDVKFTLSPSFSFINEMKAINGNLKKLKN